MQTAVKPKSPSQKERILKYIQTGNRITPIKALELFNCFSLAQRIANLKNEGHIINTRMIRTNSGKQIAEYSYIKKN